MGTCGHTIIDSGKGDCLLSFCISGNLTKVDLHVKATPVILCSPSSVYDGIAACNSKAFNLITKSKEMGIPPPPTPVYMNMPCNHPLDAPNTVPPSYWQLGIPPPTQPEPVDHDANVRPHDRHIPRKRRNGPQEIAK